MVCIAHRPVSKKNNSYQKATSAGQGRIAKAKKIEAEFSALKNLLPEPKAAESSLDVVLNAIEYIQALEKRLMASSKAVDAVAIQKSFAKQMKLKKNGLC